MTGIRIEDKKKIVVDPSLVGQGTALPPPSNRYASIFDEAASKGGNSGGSDAKPKSIGDCLKLLGQLPTVTGDVKQAQDDGTKGSQEAKEINDNALNLQAKMVQDGNAAVDNIATNNKNIELLARKNESVSRDIDSMNRERDSILADISLDEKSGTPDEQAGPGNIFTLKTAAEVDKDQKEGKAPTEKTGTPGPSSKQADLNIINTKIANKQDLVTQNSKREDVMAGKIDTIKTNIKTETDTNKEKLTADQKEAQEKQEQAAKIQMTGAIGNATGGVATAAGALATTLGQVEIGTPLTIGGSALSAAGGVASVIGSGMAGDATAALGSAATATNSANDVATKVKNMPKKEPPKTD